MQLVIGQIYPFDTAAYIEWYNANGFGVQLLDGTETHVRIEGQPKVITALGEDFERVHVGFMKAGGEKYSCIGGHPPVRFIITEQPALPAPYIEGEFTEIE